MKQDRELKWIIRYCPVRYEGLGDKRETVWCSWSFLQLPHGGCQTARAGRCEKKVESMVERPLARPASPFGTTSLISEPLRT